MSATPSAAARGSLLAAASLTIMSAAIIAPSLPAMARTFSAVPGNEMLVRLALTITSLAIAVTAPLVGTLADRVGRKPLLLAALALYTLAGVTGFFVTDLTVLLTTRVALGVAVGGIMTAVSTVITDWFEGAHRAQFLALQQASASLGGVVFLPLAGLLAGQSWQAPFLLYAAGALVLPLIAITLREPDRTQRPATQQATTDIPQISHSGWRIAGTGLVALTVTVVFFMAPTQLPFSLRELGASTLMIGIVVAGSTATGVIGALAFPRLRRTLSPTLITGVSVLLLGVGWVLIGTTTTLAQVIGGVLLGGIGVGMAVPNLNFRLASLARPEHRGRVLSTLVTAIFFGQFLSPLALQPLIAVVGIPAAFAWTGIALTLAATATLVVAALHRRATPIPASAGSTHP